MSERSTDCSMRRPVIQPSAPDKRARQRHDLADMAARLPRGDRTAEAADALLAEKFFDACAIRRKGANAFAVARFRLAPHIVGFGKQSPGFERHDIDVEVLGENGVNDRLILDPEAGREHQPPGDGLARRLEPAKQVQTAGAIRKLRRQHRRNRRGLGWCGKRDAGGGLGGHGNACKRGETPSDMEYYSLEKAITPR